MDTTPQQPTPPLASVNQTTPGVSLVAAEPSHIHIPRPSRRRRAVLADDDAGDAAPLRLTLDLALENAA